MVRAGIENQLGMAGGFLFGLVGMGRNVNLSDFRIDLGKEELSFFGSWSTNRSAKNRPVKIVLSPPVLSHHGFGLVKTFTCLDSDFDTSLTPV